MRAGVFWGAWGVLVMVVRKEVCLSGGSKFGGAYGSYRYYRRYEDFSGFEISDYPRRPVIPRSNPMPPFFVPICNSLCKSTLRTIANSGISFSAIKPFDKAAPGAISSSVAIGDRKMCAVAFAARMVTSNPPRDFGDIIFHLSMGKAPVIAGRVRFRAFVALPNRMSALSEASRLRLGRNSIVQIFVLDSSKISCFGPTLMMAGIT